MNTQELPDKLSELILLALQDLEACEKDPAYIINMYTYHYPNILTGKCGVCLAGVVLAKTMKVSITTHSHLKNCDSRLKSKLMALDAVRKGEVSNSLSYLGGPYIPRKFNRDIPDYAESPEAFKSSLRELAAELLVAGF